ncbi:uncharacterized protein V6R79_002221 [Siganus canaliculatus]
MLFPVNPPQTPLLLLVVAEVACLDAEAEDIFRDKLNNSNECLETVAPEGGAQISVWKQDAFWEKAVTRSCGALTKGTLSFQLLSAVLFGNYLKGVWLMLTADFIYLLCRLVEKEKQRSKIIIHLWVKCHDDKQVLRMNAKL